MINIMLQKAAIIFVKSITYRIVGLHGGCNRGTIILQLLEVWSDCLYLCVCVCVFVYVDYKIKYFLLALRYFFSIIFFNQIINWGEKKSSTQNSCERYPNRNKNLHHSSE